MSEENKKAAEKDHYKRHVLIFRTFTILSRPFFRILYGLKCPPRRRINGPYVVVSNHVTNLDPWLLATGFKNQMYFIASEQFYRRGFKSKILHWAFEPISKIKGASDKLTVMKSIRRLRENKNICVFPEGNRTFNGVTGKTELATGKFIKVGNAGLVTCRIEGGYMTFPRWGFGMRRGKMSAKIVNVYSREQIKNMSPEEITAVINRDIYVNAYEQQDKEHFRYKGKNLAYGMECACCVCPSCRTINSIKTEGNKIFCTSCNTSTELDEYGYFGENFPMRTVLDWDNWQENFYKEYVDSIKDNDTPLFQDSDVNLRTVTADHETKILGSGSFVMFKNRFELRSKEQTLTFPISNVPDTSVYGKTNFDFSDSEGIHYELFTDKIINVRKYLSCWKIIRESPWQ